MKEYYINDRFDFFEEKDEEYMLYCEVEEDGNNLFITLATLSYYFKDKIIGSAKKKWSSKDIKIKYKENIPMNYPAFRHFKLKFFK